MTGRESVVVTGYGAVSPYGAGVSRLVAGLRSGESAVRSMVDLWRDLPRGSACLLGAPVLEDPDVSSIPRKQRRCMSRGGMLAHLATEEALERADLPRSLLGSGRVGAIFGDTIASPDGLESFFRSYLIDRDITHVPAGGFFRVMGHSASANIAANFGIRGRVLAMPAACAAGAFAVGTGFEHIRWGVSDVMICGGLEELHPLTSAIFDLVGASSTHFNDRPGRAPAPFDAGRDGTVCGEGAGVLVLESESHARRRGAKILARLLGFSGLADGSSMAQPSIESMVACFRQALADAEIGPGSIDYVNAHATATPQGDAAEAQAIAAVFGGDVRVSGLKGYVGHTLGASGTIESIASLEMMRGGFVVPTGKLVEVDPACAMIRHQRVLEETTITHFAKSAFGFGGMNAVLIFARYDHGSH
jgi:3-oxoacyl-[acyl-carrier-protein] synthase II